MGSLTGEVSTADEFDFRSVICPYVLTREIIDKPLCLNAFLRQKLTSVASIKLIRLYRLEHPNS